MSVNDYLEKSVERFFKNNGNLTPINRLVRFNPSNTNPLGNSTHLTLKTEMDGNSIVVYDDRVRPPYPVKLKEAELQRLVDDDTCNLIAVYKLLEFLKHHGSDSRILCFNGFHNNYHIGSFKIAHPEDQKDLQTIEIVSSDRIVYSYYVSDIQFFLNNGKLVLFFI